MSSIDWSTSLAESTRFLRRSAVREILKAAVRPDVISFGGGLPAAECFPSALVAEASGRMLEGDRSAGTLQYGESEGLKVLRESLAAKVSRPVDEVLITAGAQQGLDLLGRALLQPGDTVLVENPTYLGALGAWRPHGVRFLPVAMDGEGMRIDEAEAWFDRGERPKFLYTMPNFQNPGGVVLSLKRRHALLELAQRHGLLLLEDDPYGELRYDGDALPSLLQLAADKGMTEQIVRLESFSKIVAPGLRVGWLTGARPLVDVLIKLKQAADFHPNILGQRIIHEVIGASGFPGHLRHLREIYGRRRDAMENAVRRHFPEGTQWTTPQGGMFLMARLPDGFDAADRLEAALEAKVLYVTVDNFSPDDSGRDAMRLNFTNASEDRIEEGIARLGKLFSAAS